MPSYDASSFDPPAPVVRVTLRNPQSGVTVSDAPLVLDSGADVTLLPRDAFAQLAMATLGDRRYELMGFDGHKSFAAVAMLDVLLLNRTFRGRYLLLDGEHGILGRDVLNHLVVLLDGPRRQGSEYGP